MSRNDEIKKEIRVLKERLSNIPRYYTELIESINEEIRLLESEYDGNSI